MDAIDAINSASSKPEGKAEIVVPDLGCPDSRNSDFYPGEGRLDG